MNDKIQIGSAVDNGKPTDAESFLTDASYFRRATMIHSEQESNCCEGSGEGASDIPRENLSFDIPSSSALSNRIASERLNLKLLNEQAKIEGCYITPITCDNGWRNCAYLNSRCRLMEEIARQIRSRRTNRRPPKHLPKMVKHIEIILYRCASSINSYTDVLTLEKRLESLSSVLKRKLRKPDNSERRLSKTSTVMGTLPICDMKKRLHNTLISKTSTRPEMKNLQSKINFQVRHKQGPSHAA